MFSLKQLGKRTMVWSEKLVKNKIMGKELVITTPANHQINIDELVFGNQTSLELHLSQDLYQWDFNTSYGQDPAPIDPTSDEYDFDAFFKENTRKIKLKNGKYILKQGELILWKTYESIKMPHNVFARVETKSKIARIGISCHNTAPAIQRNFNDRIMLEITNTSDIPVVLRPYFYPNNEGTVIAQLFFERVDGQTCIQSRAARLFLYDSTPNSHLTILIATLAIGYLLNIIPATTNMIANLYASIFS